MGEKRVRIAAAGDIHVGPDSREHAAAAFADVAEEADLVLLAGDLTNHGEPDEAAVLADVCRGLEVPVITVLGNHDWHVNRSDEVVEVLTEAGIVVLDRDWTTREVNGIEVGIVGTKGFIGGFPDTELPDFGEPLLRQVYAETTAEVAALERGLAAIAHCSARIVLLHYAPTTTTLEGEPRVIWAFLGSDRLAGPIEEHCPDLVLHGHGHSGTFEGFIGTVPVFNVAVSVMGRDFWFFDVDGSERGQMGRELRSVSHQEVGKGTRWQKRSASKS
ncbi:MAG TPA: metallophosphoesterase [Gaiellaceae bacterium]|nr:metallophosphoesterase [Gaiellaceae bacterium]